MASGPIDVDRATMTRVASSALGKAVADVAWEITPLRYMAYNPISQGLYRVDGSARDGDAVRKWSSVLKVCRPPAEEQLARLPDGDRERVLDTMRWDREAEAYASRLFADLPDGVVAPRCYGIDRRADGAWLWLEHVIEDEPAWSVARYGLAARHLGRLNGAKHVASAAPRDGWLSRDWIRKWTAYFARSAGTLLADERIWSTPVVAAHFSAKERDELRALLPVHERWLSSLDGAPHTLAHLDAFRANMLSRTGSRSPETVLVDWAFVGYAPLGADPAHLVVASLYYHGDRADVVALEAAVVEGFASGLADVGYAVPREELERLYAINALARMTFVLGPLSAAGDPAREQRLEAMLGAPYARIVERLADRTRYLCGVSRRAHLD